MKAAVLHKPGARLVVEDVDDPQPGPGEILIKVKACGVCHTDLHLAAGEWRLPKLPLIMGHEAVGTVEAVGAGVTSFKAGDRVAGADLSRLRGASQAEAEQAIRAMQRVLNELAALPFTTVAAINGPAVGGGLDPEPYLRYLNAKYGAPTLPA